jgi:predicted nucleotidyltransferase
MNKISIGSRHKGRNQIPKDLCRKINEFSVGHDEIVAIYLFGSIATAKNRPGSDIDVAIMVRSRIKGMERVQLETSLSNLLKRDVDLVVFGEASPLLQHQILRNSRLVYERDPKERVRQEVAARCEYLDTASLYKVVEAYP